MQKQKKSKPFNQKSSIFSQKLLLVGGAILLIGALAYGGYTWRNTRTANDSGTSVNPQNTVDYSPGTPEDNKPTEENKSNNPSGSGTLDDQPPDQPASFTVTVTGANPDPANRVVRVGTLVTGTTAGTCTLTLTQDGQANVTATNQVELQNNSYVCPVFTIPYDSFPASGQWKVSVKVAHEGKSATGHWEAGPITIQK